MNRKSSKSLLQQRPTRWALGIAIACMAYALIQPAANQRLGWQLPSLAGLLEQVEPAAEKAPGPSAPEREAALNPPAHREQVDSSSQELLYGLLRETAPEDYLSPAGLRYTRGSQQGHRLKHIERHLQDQPDRPGKHGVFYGDMAQVLRWLDESYERADGGAEGTSKRVDGPRTVYEARWGKAIGYVGGRDGMRANHPEARRIRLVTEGNRVITAFPY